MVIIFLALFGLIFGSFTNALVWRLHEQAKTSKNPKGKSKKDLSMVHGRSMCPHCKHELAAKDLVPAFSWLWLKGRCRYCHKKIDDNPLVELLMPVFFVGSYIFWPSTIQSPSSIVLFIFWLIFLVGFMALAVYDLRWYILPDKIIYPLMVLAVVQVLAVALVFDGDFKVIGNAIFGFLIGGGLFYILFQVSSGRWIGGGDVKLGGLLGLVLASPSLTLLMIFTASLLGTIVAVPLMATGKANTKTHLPFGPYLIIATVLVRLFGMSVITWYKHHLLLT